MTKRPPLEGTRQEIFLLFLFIQKTVNMRTVITHFAGLRTWAFIHFLGREGPMPFGESRISYSPVFINPRIDTYINVIRRGI